MTTNATQDYQRPSTKGKRPRGPQMMTDREGPQMGKRMAANGGRTTNDDEWGSCMTPNRGKQGMTNDYTQLVVVQIAILFI